MKIRVYSRYDIERIFREYEKNKSLLENSFIISISTPVQKGSNAESENSPILAGFKNVLRLWFEDIGYNFDSKFNVRFDEVHAHQIKIFAETALLENKDLIIHCAAGISRSPAIAEVLNEYINKFLTENPNDYEWFYKFGFSISIRPNTFIKHTLRDVLFEFAPPSEALTPKALKQIIDRSKAYYKNLTA